MIVYVYKVCKEAVVGNKMVTVLSPPRVSRDITGSSASVQGMTFLSQSKEEEKGLTVDKLGSFKRANLQIIFYY